MPDGGLVTPAGLVVPAAALSWRFSRAGGPGGQHVNTSDTRVELVCDVTLVEAPEPVRLRLLEKLGGVVRIVAAAERSQLRNRALARERLATRLDRAAARRPPRRPTRPSRGSVEARLAGKRRQAQRKADRRRVDDE